MRHAGRLFSFLLIFFLFWGTALISQNQNKKWYFGNLAGLDFMTSPPAIIAGSAMNAFEGCSSIADASGNLLFYTNGITVWNRLNQVMANGTGLMGGPSASNSGLIIKQPGNASIYFIFTLDQLGFTNGLRYTTIDMSLAAGMGSVTAMNTLIFSPSTEKLAATRHCNGVDIWVVSRDYPGNNFRSLLVTSSGISSPVLSSAGTVINSTTPVQGCMRISPTGNKLCISMYAMSAINGGPAFELYDFNNSTGSVSNSFLISGDKQGYSCEFSADGSKLYGCTTQQVLQWDLCAGSNAAVVASQYTLATYVVNGKGQIRRATNGKIYVAVVGTSDLDVINTPNVAGAGSNYVNAGQSVSPQQSTFGLPNFVFDKIPPLPFTYSANTAVNCAAISFTSPSPPTITVTACTSVGYSLTNMAWDFGDPGSGGANTSTAANPTHIYPGPGTYTAQLIYYYTCGGGTDTLKQQVIVGQVPSGALSYSICSGKSYTLTAPPANSYSWSTGASTSSISVSPSVTTVYTVAATTTNGCLYSGTTTVVVLPLPNVIVSAVTSTVCESTGTTITVSGANGYLWYSPWLNSPMGSGATLQISPGITGVYTVTGIASTGCINSSTFTISVIPRPNLQVAGITTICPGSVVQLTVDGASSYTWSTGSNASVLNYTPLGTAVNTLIVTGVNANNNLYCYAVQFVTVVATQSLAVAGFSYQPVCINGGTVPATYFSGFAEGGVFTSGVLPVDPQTGLADASNAGAGNYTVQYSVIANGCRAAGTYTAVLVVVPAASLNVDPMVTIVPGESTVLQVDGGGEYSWGPTANLSCANCANPVASPTITTRYCVSSYTNGCRSEACVDVVVSCEGKSNFSVPTAFSPNSDGKNDEFCLQGWSECIHDFKVMIYDRWGERVFESNNPSFCWNGIYKGQPLGADVFVYVIRASMNNKQVNRKGNITLIR